MLCQASPTQVFLGYKSQELVKRARRENFDDNQLKNILWKTGGVQKTLCCILKRKKPSQTLRLESRWGDSSRSSSEFWITLRGFKPDQCRVLNHVEGIQTGPMPRLESRWGDSSRSSSEFWITLRGFKPDQCRGLNHVEGIQVGQALSFESRWGDSNLLGS
jgi:hypothetical protein